MLCENVTKAVINLAKFLGKDVQVHDIDVCQRLWNTLGDTNKTGNIVKYVWRLVADGLKQAIRLSRNLSTRHLGLMVDSSIFINWSLYKARHILLALTGGQ